MAGAKPSISPCTSVIMPHFRAGGVIDCCRIGIVHKCRGVGNLVALTALTAFDESGNGGRPDSSGNSSALSRESREIIINI